MKGKADIMASFMDRLRNPNPKKFIPILGVQYEKLFKLETTNE
jgi:hypothetical protein